MKDLMHEYVFHSTDLGGIQVKTVWLSAINSSKMYKVIKSALGLDMLPIAKALDYELYYLVDFTNQIGNGSEAVYLFTPQNSKFMMLIHKNFQSFLTFYHPNNYLKANQLFSNQENGLKLSVHSQLDWL